MFVAKNKEFQHVLRGSQVGSRTIVQSTLSCPICGTKVEYHPSADHPFNYFEHVDESPDCFSSDGVSDGHRLAVEIAVEAICNRLVEVTGEPVDIGVERWVGSKHNFVISDIKVFSPLRITAEIFYRAGCLALKRRLKTLTAHDYRTFLIFHTGGIHDVKRINRYMQRLSPLRVGQFDPEMREIVLGDLFSYDRINFGKAPKVPNYMIFTR